MCLKKLHSHLNYLDILKSGKIEGDREYLISVERGSLTPFNYENKLNILHKC